MFNETKLHTAGHTSVPPKSLGTIQSVAGLTRTAPRPTWAGGSGGEAATGREAGGGPHASCLTGPPSWGLPGRPRPPGSHRRAGAPSPGSRGCRPAAGGRGLRRAVGLAPRGGKGDGRLPPLPWAAPRRQRVWEQGWRSFPALGAGRTPSRRCLSVGKSATACPVLSLEHQRARVSWHMARRQLSGAVRSRCQPQAGLLRQGQLGLGSDAPLLRSALHLRTASAH